MTTPLAASTRRLLADLGVPETTPQTAASPGRFPDGSAWRIEIPSVEGPAVLEAVLAEADRRGLRVNRVSQGSGIGMLTGTELDDMIAIGADRGVEVCLFVGPRARWDVGAQANTPSGAAGAAALRGTTQLALALDDVHRGCEHGLRSVLVADVGLLRVLAQLRDAGELPRDLVLKTSVALPAGNPATARVLAELGADSINLPSDLTTAQLAEIRAAVNVPLDLYVESPDDFGGLVRHWEIADIVRAAAPVYLKLGVRNAPALYPCGTHLEPTAIAIGRERVRRASIALELLSRHEPRQNTAHITAAP